MPTLGSLVNLSESPCRRSKFGRIYAKAAAQAQSNVLKLFLPKLKPSFTIWYRIWTKKYLIGLTGPVHFLGPEPTVVQCLRLTVRSKNADLACRSGPDHGSDWTGRNAAMYSRSTDFFHVTKKLFQRHITKPFFRRCNFQALFGSYFRPSAWRLLFFWPT